MTNTSDLPSNSKVLNYEETNVANGGGGTSSVTSDGIAKATGKKQFTIVTINVLDNYGNRLQNLALQKLLEPYGQVQTALRIYRATTRLSFAKQLVKKKVLEGVRQMLVYFCAEGLRGGLAYARRVQRGRIFNHRFVRMGGGIVSALGISTQGRDVRANTQGTIYVLGSDQVWNFKLLGATAKKDILASFALFASPAKGDSAISYAASFGVSRLPQNQVEAVTEGLRNVSRISVRESGGVDIVRSCIGTTPELVLDPTFLVPPSLWRSLLKKSHIQPSRGGKYILTHLLGVISPQRKAFIEGYAHTHGLKIRSFRGMRDYETEASGPLEFLSLIANAEMEFTDSFHATCFSIIFRKQFKTFSVSYAGDTSDTNSRISGLLSQLGIEDVMRSQAVENIDYARVDEILKRRREESLEWLRSAVESCDFTR